ncbi:Asp-tRNAAsn/Glu-tRNAGln amidotransferase B subunit [Lactiplantibacillus plantarum]|jgi:hypothetical protein|nr:Asp-tRNAAsn/Glu-tRNAGln amidotransferase B subunit [Lactiplantibacillus plantarum]
MTYKWTWKCELKKAHLLEEDAGKIVGLSKSQMSQLAKRITLGNGLTASCSNWMKHVKYNSDLILTTGKWQTYTVIRLVESLIISMQIRGDSLKVSIIFIWKVKP